jgi:hypothetical protein
MDLQCILNTPLQRRLPSEIPETPLPLSQISTQSWDSQDGPRPNSQNGAQPDSNLLAPHTPKRSHSLETSRDIRLMIQTALLFKIPYKEICKKLNVTEAQIRWAKKHRLTPQKTRAGRPPQLCTPQRRELETWLLESPSHRRVPFRNIPLYLPHLNVKGQSIGTAFKILGYCRRTSKKKGFSDDAGVMAERVAFAQEGITWSRQRVQKQMFSDEVWANGGAHTVSYVTVKEDGSDRYSIENLQHKYSKAPAWMFHGTIIDGKKGPAQFWEKEWGSMDSTKYDEYILSHIGEFLQEHAEEGYVLCRTMPLLIDLKKQKSTSYDGGFHISSSHHIPQTSISLSMCGIGRRIGLRSGIGKHDTM